MDTAWRIIDCSSLEGRITSDRGAICVHQDDGVSIGSRRPMWQSSSWAPT
ncbi:hypothetical protein [Actinomyces oris]|nr:hypothetical protein [Actinomyces oris]